MDSFLAELRRRYADDIVVDEQVLDRTHPEGF